MSVEAQVENLQADMLIRRHKVAMKQKSIKSAALPHLNMTPASWLSGWRLAQQQQILSSEDHNKALRVQLQNDELKK